MHAELEVAWTWLKANPWILGALLILLSLAFSRVIGQFFTKVLTRLVGRTSSTLDDKVITQLQKPLQLTVVLGSAMLVVHAAIVEDHIRDPLFRGLESVLIVVWCMVAVRVCSIAFHEFIRKRSQDRPVAHALPLLNNLIMVLLLGLGAYWLLSVWKINVTPLLASAGIATAAIALASKDTLSNFFGGVSIFVDRPYRLGDYIILEKGERGKVVDIGVRSTRLLTRDDVLITVPNALMANTMIINQSGHVARFRVRVKVGVGYDSDPEQVEKTLLDACQGFPEIIVSPGPRVRFRSFGDSALEYELLFWVRDPGDRGRVTHEVNTSVLKKLRAANIEIPFPQRVVHLPGGRGGAQS